MTAMQHGKDQESSNPPGVHDESQGHESEDGEEMNLPRESEGGLGLSNDPEQVVSGRFASVLTP